MSFTLPVTMTGHELITANILNLMARDNLNFLNDALTHPAGQYGVNYTNSGRLSISGAYNNNNLSSNGIYQLTSTPIFQTSGNAVWIGMTANRSLDFDFEQIHGDTPMDVDWYNQNINSTRVDIPQQDVFNITAIAGGQIYRERLPAQRLSAWRLSRGSEVDNDQPASIFRMRSTVIPYARLVIWPIVGSRWQERTLAVDQWVNIPRGRAVIRFGLLATYTGVDARGRYTIRGRGGNNWTVEAYTMPFRVA